MVNQLQQCQLYGMLAVEMLLLSKIFQCLEGFCSDRLCKIVPRAQYLPAYNVAYHGIMR